MPKLLIETRMNSLSLCESKSDKKLHPGCLGTLEGPCADYKNPTRNKNFYSRKLWENVFNDPIVKESLEDRILIGELDHPGDRLETKAVNACIVMTDYEFDDSQGLLRGTFDILDTPNGRILKSLLDAGCKIGVSSRGEGDVTAENDVDSVDEDTYNFVGFDAVVLPAVKAAKPTLRESLQKHESLHESLSKEVEKASSTSDLELIKKIVEATDLPDSDSLVESINNKSKELEGTTSSSNLLEDLEKADSKIEELQGQISTLTSSLTTCKSRLKGQLKSRQKLVSEIRQLKKEYGGLNSKYSTLVFETADRGQSSANDKQIIESLKSALEESKKYSKKLRERLTTSRAHCIDIGRQVRSLQEDLRVSESTRQSLEDDRLGHDASRQRVERSLRTKVESLLHENDELKKSNQELNESLRVKSSKLNESLVKRKEAESNLQSSYSYLVNEYVALKSKTLGVDPSLVLEGLSKTATVEDINHRCESLVERMDRYKKLPITTDRALLSALSRGGSTVKFDGSDLTKSNEEEQATESFMRKAMKF